MSGIYSKQYKIQFLDSKPGLYFAKRFQFALTSEHWTIAIDTDLKEIEQKLDRIKLIWEETSILRNSSDTTIWAGPYFLKAWNAIIRTTARARQLYEIVGAEVVSPRSRRGIFNSIGFGLKTLFGTMDSDDAEYYNEKISTIDSNQHRIYQLEKDQLTVVKHTVTAINHTMRDFKNNQDIILQAEEYLKNLQDLNRASIKKLEDIMITRSRAMDALKIIETVCNDIDVEINKFYLGIDAMRQGKLSTMLISPERLSIYLNEISLQLRTGSTLPLIVTPHTIHTYYDIIEVVAMLVQGHIIRVFLRVPLKYVDRTYTLYEVLPIPTPTPKAKENSLYTFINPAMEFIAISVDELHFMPMTQRQVDECRGGSIRICNKPNVVNHLNSGLETCEIAFFKGVTPPMSRCDVRITYIGTSIWVEIPRTLAWLFVIPREESLTITCLGLDGHPEHEGTEWVQGTGIIDLPTKCQMVGSSFTIYSRISYQSTEKINISNIIKIPTVNFSSNFNLNEQMYNIVYKKLTNSSHHLRYVTNRFQDIQAASIKLSALDDLMKQYEPNNFVPEPRHYISATILIILIAVAWYFRIDHICMSKRNVKLLPLFSRRTKPVTKDEELTIDELEVIPLEDRIKMNRRK